MAVIQNDAAIVAMPPTPGVGADDKLVDLSVLRAREVPKAVAYCWEVVPRLGIVGLAIGSITVDMTAFQVVNTSQGKLNALTISNRLELLRLTAAKQALIVTCGWGLIRELKLGLDHFTDPAIALMIATGAAGVPAASLQYNLAIRDTYAYFKVAPERTYGIIDSLRLSVAPGLFWSFWRAAVATGGALHCAPTVTAQIRKGLQAQGVELPEQVSKVAGGLGTGAVFALGTQWMHNAALMAGRMAVMGEKKGAPCYNVRSLRTAWKELGVSLFYLNFPQRMAIQAQCLAVLSAVDVFHRPELSLSHRFAS